MRSPKSPKKKNGRINDVFFLRKCMTVFARRQQKVAVISRWPLGGVSLYFLSLEESGNPKNTESFFSKSEC